MHECAPDGGNLFARFRIARHMKERIDAGEATIAPATATALPAVADGALPDAAIVARVLAGDSALYELIMRRYNRLLFRVARGIVREDDEARDVVQAAYVRAYYHLSQFRGPAGFKTWLARIAINEALGRARRTPALVGGEEQILAFPDLDT